METKIRQDKINLSSEQVDKIGKWFSDEYQNSRRKNTFSIREVNIKVMLELHFGAEKASKLFRKFVDSYILIQNEDETSFDINFNNLKQNLGNL
jgi:hypothetical protein